MLTRFLTLGRSCIREYQASSAVQSPGIGTSTSPAKGAANHRDIGHGEHLPSNIRLAPKNIIEIPHAASSLVALTEPPLGVLIELDVRPKPRCRVMEMDADGIQRSISARLLIMWIRPLSRADLPVSLRTPSSASRYSVIAVHSASRVPSSSSSTASRAFSP
jgi:hypothetical protein